MGFLSTKFHKVDQNINRNKSSFLAKEKESEYYGEEKTYVFASERLIYEVMDHYINFIMICKILTIKYKNIAKDIQ